MRISDWSSDVCSSDLPSPLAEVDYALRWNAPAYRDLLIGIAAGLGVHHHPGPIAAVQADDKGGIAEVELVGAGALAADLLLDASGTATLLADRKRVVEGKRVSVRVVLGGCRII